MPSLKVFKGGGAGGSRGKGGRGASAVGMRIKPTGRGRGVIERPRRKKK